MQRWLLGRGVGGGGAEEDQEGPARAAELVVKGKGQWASGQRHGCHLQAYVSCTLPRTALSPHHAAAQLKHAPPAAVGRDVLPPNHRVLVRPQPSHLQLPRGKASASK